MHQSGVKCSHFACLFVWNCFDLLHSCIDSLINHIPWPLNQFSSLIIGVKNLANIRKRSENQFTPTQLIDFTKYKLSE